MRVVIGNPHRHVVGGRIELGVDDVAVVREGLGKRLVLGHQLLAVAAPCEWSIAARGAAVVPLRRQPAEGANSDEWASALEEAETAEAALPLERRLRSASTEL